MFPLNCRLFFSIDLTSDRTASLAIDHSCIQIFKNIHISVPSLWKAGASLRKLWLVYFYLLSMPQCSLKFSSMFTETPQLTTWQCGGAPVEGWEYFLKSTQRGEWLKEESSEDELIGRIQGRWMFSISSSCKVQRKISVILPSAEKLRKPIINYLCLQSVSFTKKIMTNLCYQIYRQKVEKKREMSYQDLMELSENLNWITGTNIHSVDTSIWLSKKVRARFVSLKKGY